MSSRFHVLPSLICHPTLFFCCISAQTKRICLLSRLAVSHLLRSRCLLCHSSIETTQEEEEMKIKDSERRAQIHTSHSVPVYYSYVHPFTYLFFSYFEKCVCVDPCACLLACSHVFHSISHRDHTCSSCPVFAIK